MTTFKIFEKTVDLADVPEVANEVVPEVVPDSGSGREEDDVVEDDDDVEGGSQLGDEEGSGLDCEEDGSGRDLDGCEDGSGCDVDEEEEGDGSGCDVDDEEEEGDGSEERGDVVVEWCGWSVADMNERELKELQLRHRAELELLLEKGRQ